MLDKLSHIFAIGICICIYVVMSYVWSFYEYLFENYILGNDVEYKSETHPAAIILTGMLGIATTGTALMCIWFSTFCCCWNGNCVSDRNRQLTQGSVPVRNSSRVVTV